MRRLVGYLLLGVTFFINWVLQIGLFIFGVFIIVKVFLDDGVVNGLISIPIVGVILGVIHLVIGLIIAPLAIRAASFSEDKKPKGDYYEIREAREKEWEMASPEKRFELEWRGSQWYRYMEEGYSPKEADEKARQLNYDSDKRMTRWQELIKNGWSESQAYNKAIDEQLEKNS